MTYRLPMPHAVLPLLAGLFLAVCLALPVQAGEPFPGISSFQLDSFAANCLQLLERGRFAQAASLFHLDPRLDDPQRRQEQAALAAALAGAQAELGTPRQAVRLQGPRQAHQFVLQSMTEAYWAGFSRFYPAGYRVAYGRAGEGYLTLAIVVYDHRLQLRAIAFGLPVEAPESKDRIEDLVRSLEPPVAGRPEQGKE